MTFEEPEHISMLRESLRKFVDDVAPVESVVEWDKADQIPRELLEKIGELGVCGLVVPEELGGMGRDIQAMTVTIEELSRRSMALGSLYIMNTVYGSMNIVDSATPEQQERFLPDLIEGKTLFAYGLSEPDVGGDLASVSTTVERSGETMLLNGNKRWCSGAGMSEYIYALVRSGPKEERYKNLAFVIIPTDAPGVSMTSIETIGAHGIPTNDVLLDNVELSLDYLVGGEAGWNNGWSMLAGPALEAEKLQLPALAIGIAESAVAEAWQYAQERKQFGKRICGHQAIRHQLAEVQTKLETCRLMLAQAAWLVQERKNSAVQTSMAKLYVAETTVDIVLTCQRVLGAYGYAEGFGMERYVRDILVMPIFGGSSAIQKNNIASLMRLPKE